MVKIVVDHAERYHQFMLQGRDVFLRSAAPAALVRRRDSDPSRSERTGNEPLRNAVAEDTLLARLDMVIMSGESGHYEIYPLAKKPGAPFADMITIGRTANNDVVLKDITVSRFHSFFRQRGESWFVCDAGSKNGTFLEDAQLKPRKEQPVASGERVRIGDIATTFYLASDLFDVLSSKS